MKCRSMRTVLNGMNTYHHGHRLVKREYEELILLKRFSPLAKSNNVLINTLDSYWGT